MKPKENTKLWQAHRIKDPMVRTKVIDNLMRLRTHNEELSSFSLISLFVWDNTLERHDYWNELDILYGRHKIGEGNQYIFTEPLFDDTSEKIPVTPDNAVNGLRVVRGKDWTWKDQDVFDGNKGTITDKDYKKGWVTVQWDGGLHQNYRMGHGACYDLYVADSAEIVVKEEPLPTFADDIWINCKTKDEAVALLKMFHDSGLQWRPGQSYLEYTRWDTYKSNTVYNPTSAMYGDKLYLKQKYPNEKIYDASDFIKSKNSINNKSQKQKKDEKSISECKERTETTEHTGNAAYVCAKAQTISRPERRTGVAVQYRGCKVITRTGYSPNGSPAYGI